MLDIKYLEKNSEEAIKRLSKRSHCKAKALIDDLLILNAKRKDRQQKADALANTLKAYAKEVAHSIASGDTQRTEKIKKEIATAKTTYKKLTETLKEHEETLKTHLAAIPNIPDLRVPQGQTSQDNKVIHQWGDTAAYPHATTPHWTLLEKFDLASFPRGTKITGRGFPVYQNKGAQLQRALITFFLDQAIAEGYQEIIPPLIVNEESAHGTGQLPDKEGLMYRLQTPSEFYLIPTAEVPVTNLYRQEIIPKEALPIRHVAYTPCFRREAGSWGADVRGLNRLHQFDKVELVEIHPTTTAEQALEKMRAYVQKLLEQLNLSYRTLLLCTGDLGHTSAITYDMEVWSAAQKKWLEVSSASLFNDYQARRMNLRYQHNKERKYCHTINGSALALPRILAALLENNQTETHINIPTPLQPYTRFKHIEKPTNKT